MSSSTARAYDGSDHALEDVAPRPYRGPGGAGFRWRAIRGSQGPSDSGPTTAKIHGVRIAPSVDGSRTSSDDLAGDAPLPLKLSALGWPDFADCGWRAHRDRREGREQAPARRYSTVRSRSLGFGPSRGSKVLTKSRAGHLREAQLRDLGRRELARASSHHGIRPRRLTRLSARTKLAPLVIRNANRRRTTCHPDAHVAAYACRTMHIPRLTNRRSATLLCGLTICFVSVPADILRGAERSPGALTGRFAYSTKDGDIWTVDANGGIGAD